MSVESCAEGATPTSGGWETTQSACSRPRFTWPGGKGKCVDFRKWALSYLRIGMHPLPIEPRGKKPLVGWKEYQDRPPSSEEIEAWALQIDADALERERCAGVLVVKRSAGAGVRTPALVVLTADAWLRLVGTIAHGNLVAGLTSFVGEDASGAADSD